MSLILDALNKSDQEAKDYAGAPSIDANHGIFNSKKDTTKMLLLATIAVLIFIAVILLASLVFKTPQQPVPNTTPPHITAQPNIHAAPTPAIAPQSNTIDTKANTLDTKTNTAKPKASAVAALYAPDTSAEEIIIQEPEIIVATQNNVTTEEQALAQHLWNQSAPKDYVLNTTQTEATNTTTKSTVNTPTAQAADDVEYSVHHLADTPFLHNLPVSVQNTIPTLMYAEHKYAEGFTIINKKKVLVGDKAAAGVTLEEILEDGATFSMGDIRFKLGAQSSWVNY